MAMTNGMSALTGIVTPYLGNEIIKNIQNILKLFFNFSKKMFIITQIFIFSWLAYT